MLAWAAVVVGTAGCATVERVNPSFPITVEEGEAAMREAERSARPFDRPVVVVGGYMDPGVGAWVLARNLRRLTTDPGQVIEAPLFSTLTFDACRERVIEKVEARFPSGTAESTVEVDVVGISMGGLVARDAAARREGRRRLAIRRLFTISTPHGGAALAEWPSLDRRHMDMRRGSEFLQRLDGSLDGEYELIPYVRLGDAMVGAANAAPAGEVAWWVPNRMMQAAHLGAHTDPRILADIARRLRGETPFTTEPRAGIPE